MAAQESAELQSGTKRVGRDLVTPEGAGLVLDAVCEMPEWQVRQFRRTVIHIEGSRWVVCASTPGELGRHIYRLEPWSGDPGEMPGVAICYDAEYVEARDRMRAAQSITGGLSLLAAPLTPLIGLLPSGMKSTLHGVLGVHPLAATRASILLQYFAAAACGALNLIDVTTNGTMTSGFEHTFGLAVILLLDAAMRYSSVLEGECDQPGFFEWVFATRFWPGSRVPKRVTPALRDTTRGASEHGPEGL